MNWKEFLKTTKGKVIVTVIVVAIITLILIPVFFSVVSYLDQSDLETKTVLAKSHCGLYLPVECGSRGLVYNYTDSVFRCFVNEVKDICDGKVLIQYCDNAADYPSDISYKCEEGN